MPRIRTIKPGFFRSDDVTPLSYRARLTWIGLWTYVDDEGRGRDDARIIKGDLWTLEDDVSWADVEADLVELARNDRIVRYTVDGKRYLAIRKWHEHQVISRATPSRLPEPPDSLQESSVSAPGVDTAGSGSGREEETEGEEETEPSRNATMTDLIPAPLPITITPTATFDDFWNTYPRRVDRPAAQRAWTKAAKRTDPAVIVAGAARYRDDPNRVDQFTKHPGPWLNAEAWNDPPLPDRNGGAKEGSFDRVVRQHDQAAAELAREEESHGRQGSPRAAIQMGNRRPA